MVNLTPDALKFDARFVTKDACDSVQSVRL